MRFSVLAVVAAFAVGCGLQPAGNATPLKPAATPAATPAAGRYTFHLYQGEGFPRGYLLDTATGQLWYVLNNTITGKNTLEALPPPVGGARPGDPLGIRPQ